ncbi:MULTISPECIES: ATP-binding protein [Actinomadura]|uniref:ATP-binding protein n=1 Tax=Actinomadura yumaensis TaxID=111807 RepID=A0ABW2CLV2_9ACTN|nr:ATP-binding protein [Actinomadura sp. J1-007]MWK34341.1 ATP-binding protein [Actinomadura sp. J1-007]
MDTIVLPPEGASIKVARDFAGKIAGMLGVDDQLPRLVVSELVTNAWIHGSRPNDQIVVRVYPHNGRLVIEVWDRSDRQPVVGCPDAAEESGRGLLILSTLVVRWGTRPLSEGGKVVFAEVV